MNQGTRKLVTIHKALHPRNDIDKLKKEEEDSLLLKIVSICCIHTDAIIKTNEDFFRKYIPLTLFVKFVCERELETEQNCNIVTPTLMAVSVVYFSFSRAAQPESQGHSSLLDDGFLYCILSPTGLQNSIGGPEVPFGRVWLSLPHLASDVSSGPQAPPPPGFLYHISSATSLDPNCLTSGLDRVI